MAFDHKRDIFSQHFSAIASKMVVTKYSADIVIRTFEHSATLWSLHNRLRQDFELPSLGTLRRISSKTSKLWKSFLLSVFNIFNASQNGCKILHDEVYIKKMLYHGKQLFTKSVNYLSYSRLLEQCDSHCHLKRDNQENCPLLPTLCNIFHSPIKFYARWEPYIVLWIISGT